MGHGETLEMMTTGSTGAPLKITKTDVSQLFWSAIALRDSSWHRRDLGGKLAVVRVGETPRQIRLCGAAYLGCLTGPCVMFDARSDINSQLDWIGEVKMIQYSPKLYAIDCNTRFVCS
jgi:phenylacetate-CoA ligase